MRSDFLSSILLDLGGFSRALITTPFYLGSQVVDFIGEARLLPFDDRRDLNTPSHIKDNSS
jgi:hypothetical protein